MNKNRQSNICDIKTLVQHLNIALDSSMKNLPIQPIQIQNFSRNKIISYTSNFKSVISGHVDELWVNVESDLNKRIDEVKKSISNLKGKQSKLSSSLIKIERDSNENKLQDSLESDKSVLLKKIEAKESAIDNLNAEILQLEAENEALQDTPVPTIKPPSTAERNARISLKQKQQEFSNVNSEYEKMKRDFSIQIQQSSQGLERSKKEVEVLEMQINSIQSRINLMNRAGAINLQKHSLQETSKIPKLPNFVRPNGSNLPTLSLSIQCNVIDPNNTEEDNSLPTINDNILNNDINDLPKKPSSEPQQSLREFSFNRSNKPIRASFISDSDSPLQQQKSNRIPKPRIPTAEMDKTDKCLQEMSAAFLEAEQFLKELNAFDDDNYNNNKSSQDQTESKIIDNTNDTTENNDDLYVQLEEQNSKNDDQIETENKKDVKIKPKPVSEPKSSPCTPSHRRIPVMPKTPNSSTNPRNQRKKDDVSFMPISEEEMKKVARPLTCNESEKPGRRIPVNLRDGYELVFFHIAERVPKLA